MIKVFNILGRTFCLLLMIHLLAVSVCDDYLLKLINQSNTEQSLDIEKDTDNDLKEFDDFDDEYLVNFSDHFVHNYPFQIQENILTVSFQYLQTALPQSINEILIPPPRA
jgi:hypothetical protein